MFILNSHILRPASIIYSENFDAAAVSTVPGGSVYKFPASWTSPAGSPADPTSTEWQVFDDGGTYPPYSDDGGVGVPGASGLRSLVFLNLTALTESVVSEPFSTLDKTNITLDLLQYRDIGTTAGLIVEWSDDNMNWNALTFNNVTDTAQWLAAATVNLPAGAENKANIYLRLTATGDLSGLIMAIDDIVVKGI
jgi:hypothetical protein